MRPIGVRKVPETASSDRGSTTLEVAVLAPAVLLLVAMLIVAGRVQVANAAVDHAAYVAAREASLARTPNHAHAAAVDAAGSDLLDQEIECGALAVDVDTAGFSAPIGQPAHVTVTVRCTVTLSDLAMPGLGDRVLTATAVSPIDEWRSR